LVHSNPPSLNVLWSFVPSKSACSLQMPLKVGAFYHLTASRLARVFKGNIHSDLGYLSINAILVVSSTNERVWNCVKRHINPTPKAESSGQTKYRPCCSKPPLHLYFVKNDFPARMIKHSELEDAVEVSFSDISFPSKPPFSDKPGVEGIAMGFSMGLRFGRR